MQWYSLFLCIYSSKHGTNGFWALDVRLGNSPPSTAEAAIPSACRCSCPAPPWLGPSLTTSSQRKLLPWINRKTLTDFRKPLSSI